MDDVLRLIPGTHQRDAWRLRRIEKLTESRPSPISPEGAELNALVNEQLHHRITELEDALRGLRDLCEKAGMPCDRANALLAHQGRDSNQNSSPPIHSDMCAYVEHGKDCDCGLWECSAAQRQDDHG
jgi:hypothetical protein